MPADVRIESVTASPKVPKQNDHVWFTVVVANRGDQPAEGPIPVWITVKGKKVGAGYAGTLAPNATQTVEVKYPVLAGPAVLVGGLDGKQYVIRPGDPNYPNPDDGQPVVILGLDGKGHTIAPGDPNYPRWES